MNKYKALKEFSLGPEEMRVNYEVGAVFELDPALVDIPTLLADGSIELVAEPVPPVKVDYVVVKGPFANPEGEVFQTGNAVQFDEGDAFAAEAVGVGLIMTKEAHDALPKEVAGTETNSSVGAPTTPSVAGNSEPRPRYRGKTILVDSIRVVGTQRFRHIRTEEGHEYDLTEREYSDEVKVSYPPQD